VTEHRCVDGKWSPGFAASCVACQHDAAQKRKTKVKRRLES
jgi:hypothetical protein